MGGYLRDKQLAPQRMIVSPAQRTQETAELLLLSLPLAEKDIIIDKELYLADRETLCEMAALYAVENRRLLILAHNPGMDEAVDYLASSPPLLSAGGKLMTTCAVAGFRIDSVAALKKRGQGDLQYLIRPGEINAGR